jgi:putative transposase
LPPRSPNLNAYAERFVRSIKEECLSQIISIGTTMLRCSVREYVDHYHLERNHQGIGNRTIMPMQSRSHSMDKIHRSTRLGGILHFYQRVAA